MAAGPQELAAAQEQGWVGRLFTQQAFNSEYQELKFILHRKLLDRINLEMLSSVGVERVRTEVRGAVAKLVEEEKTPLSIGEKDRIIGEVLDEVFGLGPLEPLLADPTISDILVTTPRLVHIERAGKLYRTPVQFKDDAHLLRIIEKVVARVRPPRGRILAVGGCASARRLSRQRRDSSGCGRRSAALHPPIRPHSYHSRRPGADAHFDGWNVGPAAGLRSSPFEYRGLRRNRSR